MDKVVKTGLKIDLHIHSAASAHKDGVKVKNNTLENIGYINNAATTIIAGSTNTHLA